MQGLAQLGWGKWGINNKSTAIQIKETPAFSRNADPLRRFRTRTSQLLTRCRQGTNGFDV
jgi:hypothetical protein